MNRIGVVLADRYTLLELIGSGGMADVYKASDKKLNRCVAVKILKSEFSSDENFINKFKQEAMAAASISNPHVVNVYDVGEEDDINYIVMELADGITLKELIQKKGKLEIIESIQIAMQIVNGIKEAHMHGIIHRDIKPQNVMVSADGKAKVMDFGIARAVTAQTITANTVGSVHYISPEQARGSACDERCDIYSIGITLYEMITGRVPFDGESTVAIALAHIKEPITPPSVYDPMIPVSLEKIIMKCTQKKPEFRYSSADELLEDLKKALMTPDADFVREVVVPETGGTRVFSDGDAKRIKEETSSKHVSVKTQEEEDYQMGLEETDEEEIEEEKEGKIEKIVLGIGIGALILVLLIGGILIGKALHLFPRSTEISESGETVLGSNEVYMPKVAGYLQEEAEEILNDSELGCRIETKSDDKVEIGYVISASEEEGAVVTKHSMITLYVSSGKDTIPIPETIIGMEKDAAEKVLTDMGLVVRFKEGSSDEVEFGQVFDCEPGVRKEVAVGSTITLFISSGEIVRMQKVPNLLNRSSEMAKFMVETAGFVANPSFEYDDTVPKDSVISQKQEPGSKLEEGSEIEYVISLGKEQKMVKIPSLLRYSQEDAVKILKDAGLEVGNVKQEHSDSPVGTVIRQSPESGTELEQGESVDLVISLGPETAETEKPGPDATTESNALENQNDKGESSVVISQQVGSGKDENE